MNAAAIEISTRMSADAIQAELAELTEAARLDNVKHANRDFQLEAARAENDLNRPELAREIRAEGTLYDARKQRRDARIGALEGALKHLQDNDIGERLAELKGQHDRAVEGATAALAAIDFKALDDFEKQIDAFLEAASEVRAKAVVAAQTAANAGAQAPGLTAVKAPAVEALHDRLQRLAVRVSAPDLQSRGDLSRWGVERSVI